MARKMSTERHTTYVSRRRVDRERTMERRTAQRNKASVRARFAA